jgi:hypothetical protein
MYIYSAPSPLGNFSASSMDDHYWHAYSKGDTGNSTAWNGTWTVRSGYLLVGPAYGNHTEQSRHVSSLLFACGFEDTGDMII